jgi:hypothetical protein
VGAHASLSTFLSSPQAEHGLNRSWRLTGIQDSVDWEIGATWVPVPTMTRAELAAEILSVQEGTASLLHQEILEVLRPS